MSQVPTSLFTWLNYCVRLPRLIGFADIDWVKHMDQKVDFRLLQPETSFTTMRSYEDNTGVSRDSLKDSSWSTFGHLWLVQLPNFSKIGPH